MPINATMKLLPSGQRFFDLRERKHKQKYLYGYCFNESSENAKVQDSG